MYTAVSIVNSSEHSTTGWIPHNLMFGRSSGLFRHINPDVLVHKNPEEVVSEWVSHLDSHNELLPRVLEMDNVHHDVQISDLNKKNKRSIDPTIYPVGQVVFIHKEDVLGKSDVLFDGPFLISD